MKHKMASNYSFVAYHKNSLIHRRRKRGGARGGGGGGGGQLPPNNFGGGGANIPFGPPIIHPLFPSISM